MQVKRVDEALSDPNAPGWAGVASETVPLQKVPIEAQPTEYIRVKWADLPYGDTSEVEVKAATDGSSAFVRLEWAKDAEPNREFHDAAAVMVPTSDTSPANTMGEPGAPVRLWLWQDGLEGVRHLDGAGPGAFRNHGTNGISAAAASDGGRWAVVFSGSDEALRANGRLGVAVWNGSNEERAGLGATSDWVSLDFG